MGQRSTWSPHGPSQRQKCPHGIHARVRARVRHTTHVETCRSVICAVMESRAHGSGSGRGATARGFLKMLRDGAATCALCVRGGRWMPGGELRGGRASGVCGGRASGEFRGGRASGVCGGRASGVCGDRAVAGRGDWAAVAFRRGGGGGDAWFRRRSTGGRARGEGRCSGGRESSARRLAPSSTVPSSLMSDGVSTP